MKLQTICESGHYVHKDYETIMEDLVFAFSDISVDDVGSTIPVTLEQPQQWIEYISSGGKNVPNRGLSIKLGCNRELPHETFNVNPSLIEKFHTVLGNAMGIEITDSVIENFVVGSDEEGATNIIELSDLSSPKIGLINFILPDPEIAYWFTVGAWCNLTKTRFFGKSEGTEVALCFDKNEKVDLRVIGSDNVKFEIYFTKNAGEVKFANIPISLIDYDELRNIDPPFDFTDVTNPVAKDDGNFYLIGSVNNKYQR